MAVSCVKPVEFDTGHEVPLVVHCILTESNEQKLELRPATTYGKNRGELPEGLTVELQTSAGERLYMFDRKDETHWTVEMKPSYGEVYVLSIKSYGQEIIRGRTIFPSDIRVKQFMKWRKGEILNYLYCSCELRVPYVNSEHFDTYEGAAYDGSANLWVFPKEGTLIGTTHPYADDFNWTSKTVADLPCFSPDSIKSWATWMNEHKRWIINSYPSIHLHEGFVRILSPKMFDNGEDPETISKNPLYTTRSFMFFADYPRDYYPTKGLYYDIRIVSDELDLYLKDVYRKDMNRGQDMRLIYDHENTYTNIKGGMGVFGAIIYRAEEQALRGYNGDFFPDEE